MKKKILVFGIILFALCLTVFGFINRDNQKTDTKATASIESVADEEKEWITVKDEVVPPFISKVGPRFNSITKEDLLNAKSFEDFIGRAHIERIVSYKSLSVVVLENRDDTDYKLTTNGGSFSPEQLELLKTFDYSSDLRVDAYYAEKNAETGVVENSHWTPYLTVVPETQATYYNSKDAISNYLEHYSKEATYNLDRDQLKMGEVTFTVTKEGLVSNVAIESTS
ncbi:MAG: hypothetical protein HKN40_03810, partial [Winogradskyella sp.]|uniref:hypothetical protein n=1 Tax=Winogradskyella sp. TaxID=1883156 RepID=UPI00181B65B6|nr:hypothetical protein [Winogradskyella sp.]